MFVTNTELRIFYALILFSIYQFSSGYKLFFQITQAPNLNVVWVLLAGSVLLVFTRLWWVLLTFLILYCVYEYPVSSEIKTYSTNIVPLFLLYMGLRFYQKAEVEKRDLFAIVCGLYFFSGLSKIFYGGAHWHSGRILSELLTDAGFGLHWSMSAFMFLSALIVIWEMLAPLALLKTRWIHSYIILTAIFHSINYFAFGINFFYFLFPCLMLCINWKPPVHQKLKLR